MTRFGISIEKTTLFRGVQQPFANVYHYEMPSHQPTDVAQLEAALDALVVREKVIHSTVVNFVRGRLWNTGSGSQAGNQMRVDKSLSGAGSGTHIAFLDRERAFLVRWPAGTNSRGKPVYLRKWWHTCGVWGGIALTDAEVANTATLGGPDRTVVEDFADTIQTLQVAGIPVGDLVAQTGRVTTGQGECHPYLEHHQLGDQWR